MSMSMSISIEVSIVLGLRADWLSMEDWSEVCTSMVAGGGDRVSKVHDPRAGSVANARK